ncbi:MAG: heme ABC transporter permease [Aquisalimonadaceae bacterium]
MHRIFSQWASPVHFYRLTGRMIPWLWAATLLLLAVGLFGGLVLAPPDYQQGEAYRIIFVHVPSAWMAMFVYMSMAVSAAISLIWRIKLADIWAKVSAPLGASFTALALLTGSLWGKPMWGTWWVWDARITSVVILLFLYIGYMALRAAIEDRRTASRASAILILVGVVNVPIIHYSVIWWNTLHQGPTITRLDAPAIHVSMLIPLLVMALAFMLYYLTVGLMRARSEVLDQERNSRWVTELVREEAR